MSYLGDVAAAAGVKDNIDRTPNKDNDLGATLRLIKRGNLLWAINYGSKSQAPPTVDGDLIVGEAGNVSAAGVLVWKLNE